MKHTDNEFEKIEQIEGIKCKNPNCEFEDENILFEDYIKWINRKCDFCNEIILKKEEYEELEEINEIYKFMTSDNEEDIIKYFEKKEN